MNDDLERVAQALQAAGHEDAGRLVRTLAQQKPPQPQPVPADNQTATAGNNDAGEERFAQQIQQAQQRSGGWVSTPINAPAPRDTGRF